MESIRNRLSQPSIIAETPQYIIVDKPHGIATVPLKRGSDIPTLLDAVGALYPEVLGDTHEGYTLHRLDTATRGLVMFARSLQSYAVFHEMQRRGEILKEYLAICSPEGQGQEREGYPPLTQQPSFEQWVSLTSRFRAWGRGRKQVRPVTADSPPAALNKAGRKEYQSDLFLQPVSADRLRCEVKIVNGFRHQVRCHLAWCGYPILGDAVYGGQQSDVLHLFACGLSFYDRYAGSRVRYTLDRTDLDKESTINNEKQE